MTYQELLDHGKIIFGYNPNSEEFETIESLLLHSMKAMKYEYYNSAISVYSAYLVGYIEDQHKKSPTEAGL